MHVPLQAIWPAIGQTQVPDTQLVPPGQPLPQPPQFALSVARFTHDPLHDTVFAAHEQVPFALQTRPAPQFVSVRHATQLFVVVLQ